MKHALRSLARTPGFTAVAVLTLALGMGANTTFFSLLHGIVLQRLPYPDSEHLVEIRNTGPVIGANGGRVSVADLRDYRARQRSFAGIAAYDIGRVTLNSADGADRVIHTRVTANLFPLLGVSPALGRGFTQSEERAGQNDVIVVSHEFWQTHLGGATDVLGRTVRINSTPHTVVGVMPAGFSFADRATAIWQPVDFTPRGDADRTDRYLSTVARLAPGTSLARARDDLQRIAQQLRADLPAAYPADAQWSLDAVPLREAQFGGLFSRLATLMAAAAAVLLTACVNVSIMFLLRAAIRRQEMLIRVSLGAGPWHIVRQSLAESFVICALGAALGFALAGASLEVLKTFPPAEIQRLHDVGLNFPVAAFSVGVLLLVTLVVSLAPALPLLMERASTSPAASHRATDARGAVRLREALVVVEIALAVMLLITGSLALRSFRNLLQDDIGYSTARLFTFKTNLTADAYPPTNQARVHRFYDQLGEKIAGLPGVEAVAAISYLPLSAESDFIEAAPVSLEPGTKPPTFAWRVVHGPYFDVMGATLLQGRLFSEIDQAGGPLVAIVDDAFTHRCWPDPAAAIGQPVRFGDAVRTIVGVVRRLKHDGPGTDSLPHAYVPHAQVYQRGMYTVVKTTAAPATLAPLIRARLAQIDPTVPMYFVETMEQRYAATLALPRFIAGLITAFSTLALVLAAVGIFGVTAYSVARRAREFGIRFALGAQRCHVVRLVLGRVATLALLGAAIGGFCAHEFTRFMAGLLVGVDPADAPTVWSTAAIIGLTALAATFVPLTRALRVNPADALRAE